jgi:hypothetical protein
MEVHHHPEVGKKTFKEYLLEGLMIFIAVTMGFFAESIREHISDSNKELEYARSLAEDLRTDTARINHALRLDTFYLKMSDTLMTLMLDPPAEQVGIAKAYNIMWITEDEEDVNFSDRTYDALKSSGEMRLIHSSKVSDAIQHYENGVRNCISQGAYYEMEVSKMAEACAHIFKPRFRVRPHGGQPLYFGTKDPAEFDTYCTHLLFYEGVLDSYIRMIKTQKKSAVAILALLQNQYDL